MSAPGFMVITSNELEVLGEICARIIRSEPLDDPLASEQLLVMNLGMRTYLAQCLARHNGIECRCDYPQTWQLIWGLYRLLHPFVENIDLFDRDHVMLSLMALHEVWGDERLAECAPLRDYVAGDEDGSRLYELAARIADTFDQYQVYRPDWIEFASSLSEADFAAFDCGRGAGRIAEFFAREARGREHNFQLMCANVWQLRLWTLLRDNLDLDALQHRRQLSEEEKSYYTLDRSAVLRLLHRELTQEPPPPACAALPQRLFIFGVSALPGQVLNLLFDLARHVRIYLMMINPCMQYWGDLRPAWREEVRDFRRHLQSGPPPQHLQPHARLREASQGPAPDWQHYAPSDDDPEVLSLSEGNALLLSCGRQGQDLLFMLLDRPQPPVFIEAFVDPGGGSVLHELQRQLLELTEGGGERCVVDPHDRSLQLHSCHTPRREVEALRDAILARLREAREQGRPLLPRELVVMVPTINEYAPHIHAVFGGTGRGHEEELPYAISDHSEQERNPVAASMLTLLTLGERRITIALAVELLEVTPVARRFGLSGDDVAVIAAWGAEAGIHWGLDEAESRTVSEIPLPGTFSAGLRRLLEGFMAGTRDAEDDVIPPGSDGVLLGHFYDFVQALRSLRELFTPQLALDPNAWGQLLVSQVIERFYAEEEEGRASQLRAVRDIVAHLQQVCTHLRRPPRITLCVFRALLSRALDAQRSYRPFLRECINFCSLIPMRAVPFRHVFLLGLNDRSFPREERSPSFNLMMLPGMFRRGDRSRTIDDRYLFLEALLSARDSLYLSYLGQSAVDGSELSPSLLVRELLEYLADHFVAEGDEDRDPAEATGERFVIRERLLAFDGRNYDLSGRRPWEPPPSFDRMNFRLSSVAVPDADAAGERPTLGAAQAWGLHPATQLSIDLSDLIGFYSSPCGHFLARQLGIRLKAGEEFTQLQGDEPFALDTLTRGRLLSRLLESTDAEQTLRQLAARGALPCGAPGAAAATDLRRAARAMQDAAAQVRQHEATACGSGAGLRLDACRFELEVDGTPCTVLLSAEQELPLVDCEPFCSRFTDTKGRLRPRVMLKAALMSLCAALSDGHSHDVTVICTDGRLQRCAGFTPDEARPLLAELLEYYVLGQIRALPVCSELLRAGSAPDAESETSHDEEFRYLFGSVAAMRADPDNARLAGACAALYERMCAQMLPASGETASA